MFSKTIIVLFSITIFCELSVVQSRPENCGDGSKFWCKNADIARRCKKMEKCPELFSTTIATVQIVPIVQSLGSKLSEFLGGDSYVKYPQIDLSERESSLYDYDYYSKEIE